MIDCEMTDEELVENAACCCQEKSLIDNQSIRDCIIANVAKPLRQRITKLEAENKRLHERIREYEMKESPTGDSGNQSSPTFSYLTKEQTREMDPPFPPKESSDE